ncbi:hypothetical protein FHS25_006840 [Rhizobium laguerreae]|uniref:Transposase n=1 Tax=Rhizobium laguerreae TaxID=1076926 RepID=A0ABR6GLG2_9HYPH|nr:hypothetical protein [Rhizobium laguerreae]
MELEQALAVFGTEFARTAPDDRVTLYEDENSRPPGDLHTKPRIT